MTNWDQMALAIKADHSARNYDSIVWDAELFADRHDNGNDPSSILKMHGVLIDNQMIKTFESHLRTRHDNDARSLLNELKRNKKKRLIEWRECLPLN